MPVQADMRFTVAWAVSAGECDVVRQVMAAVLRK